MKVDYQQLDYLDPMLKQMLEYLEDVLDCEFVNTSNYRPGDSGVHGHGRGWDIRCSYFPFGELIRDMINQEFQYDPDRPTLECALFGDLSHLNHVHLQTHPNTIRL